MVRRRGEKGRNVVVNGLSEEGRGREFVMGFGCPDGGRVIVVWGG